MAEEILDVVDENDNVIGQEPRSKIHREGLFHREVHVLFITPNKEIIFQKRGINKDSYPGLLDATVGGHVSQGETYETAALKEMEEETGIKATID
jgi:isopentenyldiphosphate isomerase